jgi:hypothetical protein
MPPHAVQLVLYFFRQEGLVGLYVSCRYIHRNRSNGGMAKWRKAGLQGTAEWRNGYLPTTFMVHADDTDDTDDTDTI